MPRHGQPRRSLGSYSLMFEKKLDHQDDEAKNEHKDADAVDTVHILHKGCLRPVRIRLPEVEIFG
jgi:hypothetical protein